MENNINIAIKLCRYISTLVLLLSILLFFSSYPFLIRFLIFCSNLVWISTIFLSEFPHFRTIPITVLFGVILLVFSNLVWIMYCLSHSLAISLKLFFFIVDIWMIPCLILSVIGTINESEKENANSIIRENFDKILHSTEQILPPSGNNKKH